MRSRLTCPSISAVNSGSTILGKPASETHRLPSPEQLVVGALSPKRHRLTQNLDSGCVGRGSADSFFSITHQLLVHCIWVEVEFVFLRTGLEERHFCRCFTEGELRTADRSIRQCILEYHDLTSCLPKTLPSGNNPSLLQTGRSDTGMRSFQIGESFASSLNFKPRLSGVLLT